MLTAHLAFLLLLHILSCIHATPTLTTSTTTVSTPSPSPYVVNVPNFPEIIQVLMRSEFQLHTQPLKKCDQFHIQDVITDIQTTLFALQREHLTLTPAHASRLAEHLVSMARFEAITRRLLPRVFENPELAGILRGMAHAARRTARIPPNFMDRINVTSMLPLAFTAACAECKVSEVSAWMHWPGQRRLARYHRQLPLRAAVETSCFAVAYILLLHDKELDAARVLPVAAEHGDLPILRLLLNHVTDKDTAQVHAAMVRAAGYGNTEVLRVLLAVPGVDLNDGDQLVLRTALDMQQWDCAEMVLLDARWDWRRMQQWLPEFGAGMPVEKLIKPLVLLRVRKKASQVWTFPFVTWVHAQRDPEMVRSIMAADAVAFDRRVDVLWSSYCDTMVPAEDGS